MNVTFLYLAWELSDWIDIVALLPPPLPLSVYTDLSSSEGWILILDWLAWMNPALLMYHKSTTVWCHPGVFFPLPGHSVISISVVMEMWQGGRKMRALTSGSQARQFIWGKKTALCLFVCVLTIVALEKGEKGTMWHCHIDVCHHKDVELSNRPYLKTI